MAQTSNKYSVNYHNRNCIGGIGLCSDDELTTEGIPNVKFDEIIPNRLIMTLPKSTLSRQELNDITTINYFEVSGVKSFILPNIPQVKSSSTKNVQIPIGVYPIKIERDSIKVYFTISRTK